jgi:hypothetical protein
MRLFLFFAVLLAGCGGNPAPTTPTAPKEKLPIEVTGSPEDALPKKR